MSSTKENIILYLDYLLMSGMEGVAEAKKEGERVWESKDWGTHCIFGKHLAPSHLEKSDAARQTSSAFFLLLLNSLTGICASPVHILHQMYIRYLHTAMGRLLALQPRVREDTSDNGNSHSGRSAYLFWHK